MKRQNLYRLLLFIVVGSLLGSAELKAQWRSNQTSLFSAIFSTAPSLPGDENVFNPDQSSVYITGFVGFNHNTNIGEFTKPITQCQCEFKGEFGLAKFGLAFGGDITYVFSREWGAMAKIFYDDKHSTESFDVERNHPIRVGSQVITRMVNTEQTAKINLSYLTFGMFMRYQPRLDRWYVFAGPTIGKNLTNKIEQTEKLLTEGLTFIDGGTERIVSQDPIDGRDNIRAEAMVGAGYDFMMGPRLFLSPELHVAYPLTKISKSDDNWKVFSVRIAVGLKYEAF